jgi:hypothetical protein
MTKRTTKHDRWDFLVDQNDATKFKIHSAQNRSIVCSLDNRALIRIERLAFSANNILYITMGHENRYWDLFPGKKPFGSPPAWGIGTVIDSQSPHLAIGERLFGFFPIASHCVLEPETLGTKHIVDLAPRRQSLAAAYNRYTRIDDDHYDGSVGDWRLVLRPLALVGLLASHVLMDNAFFGADELYVTSASSKTGIGVGCLSKAINPEIQVVGLTSMERVEYVQSLSVYDQVISYSETSSIQARASVLFDLTGNQSLVADLHRCLGHSLLKSWAAGRSHWSSSEGEAEGVETERFFSPKIMMQYISKWGGHKFEEHFASAIDKLRSVLEPHTCIEGINERAQLENVYRSFLENRIDVKNGYVVDASAIGQSESGLQAL